MLADLVEAFRGEGAFAHSDGNAGSYKDAMMVAMVVMVVIVAMVVVVVIVAMVVVVVTVAMMR